MLLRRLQLRNHRNYAHLDLEPGPGVNVFIGANGQGKTNLLEAVAMLALSSSPRARRELELVGPAGPGSTIDAEVESGATTRSIAITLEVEGERARRTIEVDGVRRRFLNQMLVQVEPGYARALAGLKRVLEQRNSLLKRMAAGEASADVLEAWDEELIRIGGEVSVARARAVRELQPEAARFHAEIASGERLEIEYLGPPADLAEAVHNSLSEDLRRGATSIGPHRDDVKVLLDGREARAYGSQGQQRTAVVSLKLAEAAMVARRTGERPVLLLDDVLSELDGERRAALLRQVAGEGQVIITSVEAGPFPPELISNSRVWRVAGGEIAACG